MQRDVEWAHRVEQAHGQLTRSEQAVLDYITSYPEDVAFLALKELCEKTGTSKPKIIDLYRKLGYSSFKSFRDGIRSFYEYRIDSAHASRATFEHVDTFDSLIAEAVKVDERSLNRLAECVSSEDVEAIASDILGAGTTWVFGPGSGYYPAHFLAQRLRRYRLSVHNIELDTQHLAEELFPMRGGDTLLVFCYSRNREAVLPVMRFARERGLTIDVVSDTVLVDFVGTADRSVFVERGGVGFKNSMATPMTFANIVLLAVELAGGEKLQEELGELERAREAYALDRASHELSNHVTGGWR